MRSRLQESATASRRPAAAVRCVVFLVGVGMAIPPAAARAEEPARAVVAPLGAEAEPPPSGVRATNERVSAQLAAVPVGEVVSQLAEATGLEVIWLDSERGEPISANFQDLALEEAVGRLLRQRNHVLEMPVEIERRSGRQVARPRLWIGSMVVGKHTAGAGLGAKPGGQVAFAGPQGPQAATVPPGHQGAGVPRQMDIASMPAAEQAAAHAAALAAAQQQHAAQQAAQQAAAAQQQAGGGDPTHAGMANLNGVGFVPPIPGGQMPANDAGVAVHGGVVTHGGPGGINAPGGPGGPGGAGGPGGFPPGDRPDHFAAGGAPVAAGDFVDEGTIDDSEE